MSGVVEVHPVGQQQLLGAAFDPRGAVLESLKATMFAFFALAALDDRPRMRMMIESHFIFMSKQTRPRGGGPKSIP